MKKLALFLSVFFIIVSARGQEFSIGVLVPGEEQGLSIAQSNMLQTRLERLCTSNGIAVINVPDGFFLYPTISIVSDEVAEGGMRNINIVKAEVTLSVRRIDGDVVSTVGRSLSGSGYSRSQAITSLIQSLNVMESIYTRFISDTKSAMMSYYQSQCKQIMIQADQYAAIGDYRAAIAKLFRIPSNAACFASVSEQMSKYYSLFQSQLCKTVKMTVESALSTHDYEVAAHLLTEIDPSSECYDYALKQFKHIEKEVAKLEKRDWDFKMRQYNDAVVTERQVIDACRDIAKAYYSTSNTVHYTQVIK